MLQDRAEQDLAINAYRESVSDYTIETKADLWRENVIANRRLFPNGLTGEQISGTVGFLVGGGPSLRKNGRDLKRLRLIRGGEYRIVCVDVATRYLINECGVIPDIVFAIEGRHKLAKALHGVEIPETVMLACGISVAPEIPANWEGPITFVRSRQPDLDLEQELFFLSQEVRATRNIEMGDRLTPSMREYIFKGIEWSYVPGGNCTIAAIQWMIQIQGCKKIVMIGQDFSWPAPGQFYADRDLYADEGREWKQKIFKHPDIYGGEAFTNLSFNGFKGRHEEYVKMFPGVFYNATEGGILGVDRFSGETMEGMEVLTLNEAVRKYVEDPARNRASCRDRDNPGTPPIVSDSSSDSSDSGNEYPIDTIGVDLNDHQSKRDRDGGGHA